MLDKKFIELTYKKWRLEKIKPTTEEGKRFIARELEKINIKLSSDNVKRILF